MYVYNVSFWGKRLGSANGNFSINEPGGVYFLVSDCECE